MSDQSSAQALPNQQRENAQPLVRKQLLERIGEFRRSAVDPFVAGWEASHSMAPPEMYAAAAEAGVLSAAVPAEHGGLGHSFGTKRAVFDLIAETAMATSFSLINSHNIAETIAESGTPAQIERWVPDLMAARAIGCTAITEPGAGSDVTSMRTMATTDGDGWRIDGAKAWITNAPIADVIVAYVQTAPGAGASGIAGFLIDTSRPGVSCTHVEALPGGHGIGAGTFTFDGYRAESDELFAAPGDGFRRLLTGINGARTYVASMCCAMVRNSLSVAVDYAASRQAFGAPTLDFQGLRWSLADVANRLEAATALTQLASDAIDHGQPRDAVLPAAHAKKFATEIAEPSIAACMQAMGAAGLRDDHALGRHLAAARIACFTDGSTQMMTERIAGTLAADYPV